MLRKILTVLVVSLFLVACKAEQQQKQMPPPIVIVETVTMQDVKASENFVGTVDAATKASITVRVNGFLERIFVREGDLVKKNQLLFSIEKASYEATVRSAEAALAQAQASLAQAEAALIQAEANAHNAALQRERGTALINSDSISRANYDNLVASDEVAQANVASAKATLENAKAAIESAKAAIENAKLNLAYTDVVSPIDGKVGLITANIGETVSPSSGVVTTVIAPNPMYVTFTVTDRQYQQLRASYNQNEGGADIASLVDLMLVLSNGKEYQHLGALNFINNTVGSGTDALLIRGQFENPEGLLVQGQTVTVKVVSKKSNNSVVISQRAVVNDIGGKYVLVAKPDGTGEDGKPKFIAERRPIEAGAVLAEAKQVITSGLEQGEMIIVDGVQKVSFNAPVVPLTSEQAAAMAAQQVGGAQAGAEPAGEGE